MISGFQAPVKQPFCRGRQNASLTVPTSFDKEVGAIISVLTYNILKPRWIDG